MEKYFPKWIKFLTLPKTIFQNMLKIYPIPKCFVYGKGIFFEKNKIKGVILIKLSGANNTWGTSSSWAGLSPTGFDGSLLLTPHSKLMIE